MKNMDHFKKKCLNDIPSEKQEDYITYTPRTGILTPLFLIKIKNNDRLSEEILLYWEENIGWLDDGIYRSIYNNLFEVQCIVFFFNYSLDDITCNNSKCRNIVNIIKNYPKRLCDNCR